MDRIMDEILDKIREIPLAERLDIAMRMIGDMIREGRYPKMSIPVQPTDEDIFITTTLKDAKTMIIALDRVIFGNAGEE